jgi:hypothetical protein
LSHPNTAPVRLNTNTIPQLYFGVNCFFQNSSKKNYYKIVLTLGAFPDSLGGMKIYDTLDVQLTYQNFGSAWLGILRGIPDQIRLTCNGLFNLMATNGREEYHNEEETIATFWTSEEQMNQFFYNKHYLPREMGHTDVQALKAEARQFANDMVASMEPYHEEFMTFESNPTPITFGSGTITAERPDSDMKDAILSHAFTEKTSEKSIDIEES